MPRKPSDPKPPSAFPRRTAQELADALGVHRNTIAAWRHEGAPEQYDEWQWRTWAAAQAANSKGYDCPKDPEPVLFERLASAPIGDYRDRLARHSPVLGTGDAPDMHVPTAAAKEPTELTDLKRQERADTIIKETKARQVKREEDEKWHRLVSVESMHPLLDAWLLALDEVIFAGLADLPDQVSAVPEVKSALRMALDRRLRAAREQLAGELDLRLKSYLENLARTVA